MGYGSYWKRKGELTARAEKHTEEVGKLFGKEIEDSIKNSIICERTETNSIKYYDINGNAVDTRDGRQLNDSKMLVVDSTTQEAIFNSKNNKVTILNFASYKNPGGAFISGSSAQEEMLCHSSFLYNVLSKFQLVYYNVNQTDLNRGLYTDKAIFTPNVLFFDGKGNKRFANVITCAAPNKSLLYKYNSFLESENFSSIKSRTDFMWKLLNAVDDQHDELVLGAWGCGVFKQDPYEIARMFKQIFKQSLYDTITFAIPAGENLDAFNKVINE